MNQQTSLSRSNVPASAARSDGTARLALWVALGSETFFFSTILTAYFFLRAEQPSWPYNSLPLAQMLVPLGNTLLLVISAAAAALGQRAIRAGKTAGLVRWFALALTLGLVFVGGQVFEFTRSGMHPGDAAFGGVFFALMGFHAVHVIIGVVLLTLSLARARLGDFSARRHTAVDIATWFWFYVTLVWVVLFSALYLV